MTTRSDTPRVLRLAAPTAGTPAATMPAPPTRGRLLSPAQVVARYFLDVEGRPTVGARWVRDRAPHKVVLARNRVAWYEADVAAWVASLRTDGPPSESAA